MVVNLPIFHLYQNMFAIESILVLNETEWNHLSEVSQTINYIGLDAYEKDDLEDILSPILDKILLDIEANLIGNDSYRVAIYLDDRFFEFLFDDVGYVAKYLAGELDSEKNALLSYPGTEIGLRLAKLEAIEATLMECGDIDLWVAENPYYYFNSSKVNFIGDETLTEGVIDEKEFMANGYSFDEAGAAIREGREPRMGEIVAEAPKVNLDVSSLIKFHGFNSLGKVIASAEAEAKAKAEESELDYDMSEENKEKKFG